MEVVFQEETHDMDAIRLFPDEDAVECSYIEENTIDDDDVAIVIFQDDLSRKPIVIRHDDLSKYHRRSRILNIVRWLVGLSSPSSREISDKESIASTAASTECSDCSVSDVPSLMETRLLEYPDIEDSDFDFEVDRVSKEVLNPGEEPAHDNELITHVKTGVWEVKICDEDPFYVVTGVRMSDHVDTKKLRKIVLAGKSYNRRPKLTMAPTAIAEKLTGYKSGTMAPICHTEKMKLYFDESIINGINDSHRLYVGSGMPGKCLSIPFHKFWSIAKANSLGAELVTLTKPRKSV